MNNPPSSLPEFPSPAALVNLKRTLPNNDQTISSAQPVASTSAGYRPSSRDFRLSETTQDFAHGPTGIGQPANNNRDKPQSDASNKQDYYSAVDMDKTSRARHAEIGQLSNRVAHSRSGFFTTVPFNTYSKKESESATHKNFATKNLYFDGRWYGNTENMAANASTGYQNRNYEIRHQNLIQCGKTPRQAVLRHDLLPLQSSLNNNFANQYGPQVLHQSNVAGWAPKNAQSGNFVPTHNLRTRPSYGNQNMGSRWNSSRQVNAPSGRYQLWGKNFPSGSLAAAT
ncbi:hypothetical protein H0H81_006083 [Sphagnurus paluster]|uniref:Uncharacterized protein n=1 Tax=Sphagnurus paluster TaxID=117069 RepID=A0A9P7K7I6_9AGAR|nr:hypothetical protein H0H81_006083 [Sphagnurus paluster]